MADLLNVAGLDYIGRQTYLEWAKAVAGAGGIVVRLPAQSGYEGILGEKYPESVVVASGMDTPILWQRPPVGARAPGAPAIAGISYGLYLAPLSVRALDKAHLASDQVTIGVGKAAAAAENLSKGILALSVVGVVVLAYLLTQRPK